MTEKIKDSIDEWGTWIVRGLIVGCSLMQPIRHLDDLGDTSGDPVWPAQGCNIQKLTK